MKRTSTGVFLGRRTLLDVLGLAALPNAHELVESLEKMDLKDSVVHPPPAALKPVAIYR